jgi:hypothetical protein
MGARCSCGVDLHGCGGSLSGAPFGLDGLGNVVGENRRVRCCTALSPAARPSSCRARERAMAWVQVRRRRKPRAARCAMKKATSTTRRLLSSTGGRVRWRSAGPSSGGWFAARGGVGIRGGLHRVWGAPPRETKHPRVCTLGLRHASTEVSALRVAICIAADFDSHNLFLGARHP